MLLVVRCVDSEIRTDVSVRLIRLLNESGFGPKVLYRDELGIGVAVEVGNMHKVKVFRVAGKEAGKREVDFEYGDYWVRWNGKGKPLGMVGVDDEGNVRYGKVDEGTAKCGEPDEQVGLGGKGMWKFVRPKFLNVHEVYEDVQLVYVN